MVVVPDSYHQPVKIHTHPTADIPCLFHKADQQTHSIATHTDVDTFMACRELCIGMNGYTAGVWMGPADARSKMCFCKDSSQPHILNDAYDSYFFEGECGEY